VVIHEQGGMHDFKIKGINAIEKYEEVRITGG